MKEIWLDMDGTFVDLYNVEQCIKRIDGGSVLPYRVAKPLCSLSSLARVLNQVQKKGYKIGVVSWTSKTGSPRFNLQVEEEKKRWLRKHLPSVRWDNIFVISYGTNKFSVCKSGILFDDDAKNRHEWQGDSYSEKELLPVLKRISKG